MEITKVAKTRTLSVRMLDMQKKVNSSSEIITGNNMKCQEMMRKFWKSRRVKCQTIEETLPCVNLPTKVLLTGCAYDGCWEGPWMNGYGGYVFPSGVEYEGDFVDGMFHGKGELRYPTGIKIMGLWDKGTLVDTSKTVVFSDNLQYSEKDWLYCQSLDRRYKIEYDNGVQPGGKSYITADQPTRDAPDGIYDTGDGFFDPKDFVYNDPELFSILRACTEKEKNWIKKNCRKGGDKPVGKVLGLYREWMPPRVKVKPPPAPAAPVLTNKSLFKCKSIDDDDVRFMIRYLDMGGSSSSSSQ